MGGGGVSLASQIRSLTFTDYGAESLYRKQLAFVILKASDIFPHFLSVAQKEN